MCKNIRLLTLAVLLFSCAPIFAAEWEAQSFNRTATRVALDGKALFDLDFQVQGPKKMKTEQKALAKVRDDARVYEEDVTMTVRAGWRQVPAGKINVSYSVQKEGADTLRIAASCKPGPKVDEAGARLVIRGREHMPAGAVAVAKNKAGKTFEFPMTVEESENLVDQAAAQAAGGAAGGPGLKITKQGGVTTLTLLAGSKHPVVMTFDQPVTVSSDNMRVAVDFIDGPAADSTAHIKFSDAVDFEPANKLVDMDPWFEFQSDADYAAQSVIGMRDWLHKPAGQHGRLLDKGDDMVFEDGTQARFWGAVLVNHQIDKPLFDKWTDRMVKYGVNIVRFHGFGKPNTPGWVHLLKVGKIDDGLQFDKERMDLLDYGFAKFKENGIYSGWSVFYGWYPTEADKDRLIAYDELIKILRKNFPCNDSFYGVTCLAPDVQDLIIQFHVNLLNHVNPYTGVRYADEPALAWIELQNEENGFLQLRHLSKDLDKCPTYKKLFYQKFADFLREKYGSQEALAKAWGRELKRNENLDTATVHPFPGWFQEPNKRIADQMAFHYRNQRHYYKKFEKAVRDTGYKGSLCGSNWHGAEWLGHLHNLRSDADIGAIDRHSYGAADLSGPGRGLMDKAFAAVKGRTFRFTEWHGRGSYGFSSDDPIVAVYGMGLQGWDISNSFAWMHPTILNWLGTKGVNEGCDEFHGIAQWPALARMIYRNDVKEGDIVGIRRVSLPRLDETGEAGFEEPHSPLKPHDTLPYAVPREAVGVGRVVLEFVDGPVDDEAIVVDKSGPYIDEEKGIVRSQTGQLEWHTGDHGFFTVDTPGTKAVIGYGGGQAHELGNVTIAPETSPAMIYVSSLEQDKGIDQARHLLITAMARTLDKGTVLDEVSGAMLVKPKGAVGPIMIEPVKATITLKGKKSARVLPLDHDGRMIPGARPLTVQSGRDGLTFTIDGAASKAVYYVVEF